jgi:hypothetical protein
VGGDAELFKRIAEAYEVLSGRTIPAPERPTRPATPPTPPPPPPARSENYHPSAQFVLRVSLAEPGRKTRGLGALNSIIAAAESIYGARQFPQIIVCVYSDAGPYISSLRDLIVDLWNDRDILTGPAHPPEPSVWDED